VSVALLWLLFRRLDLGAVRALFTSMPVWFYLLSLGVVVSGQVLYAWRWRQVLAASGVSVSVGTAVQQYFIGIFLNNFFPSTVGGDMAKVYYSAAGTGIVRSPRRSCSIACSASGCSRCLPRRCTGWRRIRRRASRRRAPS